MLELVSELELKRVRKGHPPVDQADQLGDFRWGISLLSEFDGEFDAVVEEILRVPAVLLGAEVGSDDKERLLVPVAWVIELALEVDRSADAEAKGGTASEKSMTVRCGTPDGVGFPTMARVTGLTPSLEGQRPV